MDDALSVTIGLGEGAALHIRWDSQISCYVLHPEWNDPKGQGSH